MNLRIVVPMLVVLAVAATEAGAQDIGKAEVGLRGWNGTNTGKVRKGLSGVSSSRFSFEDDLDAGETSGAGVHLAFHTQDRHQIFLNGLNLRGSGRDTIDEDRSWGGNLFANGSQVTTDFEFRNLAVGFLYAATPAEDAFFFGAGLAFNWLTVNTELSSGGVSSALDISALHYPSLVLSGAYKFSKNFEIGAELSSGLPSYTKAHGDDIQYPTEARGFVRFGFNRLNFEVGYQVLKATILNGENTVDEIRASVHLEGVYFEAGVRF